MDHGGLQMQTTGESLNAAAHAHNTIIIVSFALSPP